MVDAMTHNEPESRVSVAHAIEMFEDARRPLSRFARRRRLHPVEESATSRSINDLHAFLYDGTYLVKQGLAQLLYRKPPPGWKKKTA